MKVIMRSMVIFSLVLVFILCCIYGEESSNSSMVKEMGPDITELYTDYIYYDDVDVETLEYDEIQCLSPNYDLYVCIDDSQYFCYGD